MISRWTRVRLVIWGVVFVALALRVGRRAYELQVEKRDELKEMAEGQYLKEIELPPQRGRILDRNAEELASTAEFDSVTCNPRLLLGVPDGPERLAGALAMEPVALRRSLEKMHRRFFAYVRRTVGPAESAAVQALALPGVELRKEPKRVYPGNELGATVIGTANVDGRGTEGVEYTFDEQLRGTGTQMQGLRDGRGRQLLLDGLVDRTSTAGKDVVLALDKYLMYVTEKALADGLAATKAKGATSVMMDPSTGEILAMASLPSYDPASPGEAAAKGFTKNRAITDIYEPGSTAKTFTMAATLETGKLSLGELVDCQLGRPLMIGKAAIHDSHPAGVLTAAQVFQQSSNIGTVKIARKYLTKQALYDALARFGFGKATGVGLKGEVRGLLHPVTKWGEVHFANIAFGQGLAVTPLQMTTAYAAIANGGIYKPPRLALRLVHGNGKVEPLPPPANARPEQRVLSEKTARTMLSIMRGVTEDQHGTARQAALDGYAVAGKTGTAQKVVKGKYGAFIPSFIGIVPADKPRLVITVVIDEPEGEHRGGAVAAPVFKQIAEAALRYLSVPRDPTIVARKPRGAPEAQGARPREAEAALPAPAPEVSEGPGSDQPLWEGPEELDASPAAAAEPEAGGGEGAEAAEELVSVPSFVGMSMGQAIRAARQAGVELAPEGSGVAVAQNPAPGPVPRGALCRVSFRPGG
jgi:cell division protein FtsI (penicillin-binding protein 3)